MLKLMGMEQIHMQKQTSTFIQTIKMICFALFDAKKVAAELNQTVEQPKPENPGIHSSKTCA
ncbi:TPA: hypothetical protein QCR51_005628 [Bacillus cereus]|nr:hypothetical protein [Bacillus cereus]